MRSFSILCALGLLACAGSTADVHEPGELSLGDADGRPRLDALPSLPRGASGQTPRTRQGLLAAREAFDARLPAAPADLSHTSLQRWVDSDVVAWIDGRSRKLETTRYEFGLEGDASDSEKIVGMAVVGLLQEDAARELGTIPVPAELDSEPEIAVMYREVVEAQARPFLSSALVGFRDCANLAHDGPDEMRHWAGFCDARFQRIKEELDSYQRSISGEQPAAAPTQTTGTTTVTVVAEPQ